MLQDIGEANKLYYNKHVSTKDIPRLNQNDTILQHSTEQANAFN